MADENANGAASATPQAANQPIFALQRVYVKDTSYEAPNVPQVFQEQGQPELQLNLGQKVNPLTEGVFEVVLTVSLTCTLNGKNAYLAEVQQAGIFTVTGFDPANTDGLLGTWDTTSLPKCAYTLRLVVSDSAIIDCNGVIHHSSEDIVSVIVAPEGDVTFDGVVNVDDLNVVLSNWLDTCN